MEHNSVNIWSHLCTHWGWGFCGVFLCHLSPGPPRSCASTGLWSNWRCRWGLVPDWRCRKTPSVSKWPKIRWEIWKSTVLDVLENPIFFDQSTLLVLNRKGTCKSIRSFGSKFVCEREGSRTHASSKRAWSIRFWCHRHFRCITAVSDM